MSEGDVSLIDTAIEIAIVSPMPREETPLSLVDQDTAQMQATGPNAVLQAAQPLAKHLVEYHTTGDLPASGDAQQIVSIEEDTTDNLSFEYTTPTKAIVLPTEQDQAAASSQLNETNAAPSVTTTTPVDVEHDEMDTTSPAPVGTTNTNSTSIPSEPELVLAANQPDHAQTEHTLTPIDKVDTVETSVTPHLPLEQVEPAEQREVEYKGAVAPAPAEETHPSHAGASDNTPLSENAKATTAPAETSPDEASIPSNTPVLEDDTSLLTPTTAPTKEISDSLDSPTVPEIPLAELSPTRDVEPAAEQLNTTNDTPWQWDRPLLAETENTSLTTSSNQATDQESTQPTSPSTSSEHSSYIESPKKPNVLQILFRIFFSRKPKNTNAK